MINNDTKKLTIDKRNQVTMRCRATTLKKEQCIYDAVLSGFCMNHFIKFKRKE